MKGKTKPTRSRQGGKAYMTMRKGGKRFD